MQVPHNAAPDTKEEVGECSLVLLLVFQLSSGTTATQQMLLFW